MSTSTIIAGVSLLLVMLVWTPITDAPHLVSDFTADTWLMQHQAGAVHDGTFPSLTLTTLAGAFYPVYAFYGGTLFAFGGLLALIMGSAEAAQITIYLLALAAAYGGWLWLARMAGVRGWPAHAPAIVYVTTPYVSTNINVRQDLAELVAGAVIPLLLASALSVLRADRRRAGPAAALAASTIVFGGTHNITLLWGTTILTITAVAVAASVPQARRLVTRRGVLRVLAIVVPAMAINAWYLLPDLAYHSDTVIAHRIDEWRALLRGPHPELATKNLLAIGHPTAFPGSGLTVVLPVLAIAWVILAGLATRTRWRTPWGRMLAILVLLTLALSVVMTHPRWILALPEPWQMIQFSYRLVTFVLFGICASIIAASVLTQGVPRRWLTALLVPILIFSVISVDVQRHDAPRSAYRSTADSVYVPFNLGDFANATLPQTVVARHGQALTIPERAVVDGRVDTHLPGTAGALYYTNVMAPPQMLHVQGAQIIGRWAAPPLRPGWQPRWSLVLRVDEDAEPGKAHLVIRQARPLPIVGGEILSLLGLVGLVANAAIIARAAWRPRQARLAP